MVDTTSKHGGRTVVETERRGFDGARVKETKEPERRRFVPETPFGNFADEKGQPCFFDERSEEKRVRPTGPDSFRAEKTSALAATSAETRTFSVPRADERFSDGRNGNRGFFPFSRPGLKRGVAETKNGLPILNSFALIWSHMYVERILRGD